VDDNSGKHGGNGLEPDRHVCFARRRDFDLYLRRGEAEPPGSQVADAERHAAQMEDAVFVSEGSDWLALDRKLNTEQRNAGGVGDLASYVAQALSAGASSTHYCRARDKDLKRQERLPTCGKHRFLQSQV